MNSNSNLDKKRYAQWFLDQGINIFPIDPESKRPVVSNWQRYSHEPLTEEEKKQFLSMIEQGYNYAVPGGQQNLVILDVEDLSTLKKWIGELALNDICGKTLCVTTPHGGLHIFLKSEEIPEHKFNPAFITKDGKGIADLQSFNSYVVGLGSCINHRHCTSEKCQWRGQEKVSCYSLYNNGIMQINTVNDFKGFLRHLADLGKKLGIELSKPAQEWVYGGHDEETEEEFEKLKNELEKFNKFKGKTVDAVRSEVCQSIKKSMENARSDKAKVTLNTAFSVVCQGKNYEELGIDRSRGDWHVLKTLLSHGVTDIDIIQQLLPGDSKVFAPKWDKYFIHTLKKAWKEVKPFLKVMKETEKKTSAKELRSLLKAKLSEALSKQIIDRYNIITFVQSHSTGETIVGIYRWYGRYGIYEPADETLRKIIRIEIMDILDLLPKVKEDLSFIFYEVSRELVNSVYEEVRDLTLVEYDEDDEPLRIAFDNYTLEWLTDNKEKPFRLIPADKRTTKDYAFHYIPHKINDEVFKSNAKLPYDINELEELARRVCPKSLEAFKQWVGEKWPVLFEIIGYTLYPRIKFKLAFMLLGPRDSGKSTFLQLVKKVLGKNNTVSVRLRELFDPNNRFVTGFLFHKLANLTAETKEYTIEDIDRFKSITGGDQVTSDVKYKGPITFTPYAKLITATNRLPNVTDKNDEAFWRRWLIIEFPNQFENDDTWFDRTFTEEEIQGILTVSILAFVRVIRNGKFDYQQTPDQVRDLWLYNIDSVWSFIKSYEQKGIITVDRTNADLWIEAKELYRLYREYCIQHGYQGVSLKTFTKKLTRYFGITSVLKYFGKDEEGKEIRRRCYVGIRINNVIPEPGNGKKIEQQEETPRGDTPYEIRNFEECLGFSVGAIAYQLFNKNTVSEEDLAKVFKNQHDVLMKVEECLPKLNFIDMGNGIFRKRTVEEMYVDFKCTTIWYQEKYNELKGKIVKIKDLDPDLLMCMKKFGHFEKIDDETIRVK